MNSKQIYSLVAGLLYATLPLQAQALLLDCEINADRTYTCIEIGDAGSPDTPEGQESYGEKYSSYIEQAKQSCVYHEPRKRTAGKGTGSARRTEEIKSARKDYEKCISDKAWEIWHQNNNSSQTAN
jgi:hypothetical protein